MLPNDNKWKNRGIHMIQKKKRTAAFTAAILICAASAAPMSASAAYGAGGNGTAIMEYLDRGIYAVRSVKFDGYAEY